MISNERSGRLLKMCWTSIGMPRSRMSITKASCSTPVRRLFATCHRSARHTDRPLSVSWKPQRTRTGSITLLMGKVIHERMVGEPHERMVANTHERMVAQTYSSTPIIKTDNRHPFLWITQSPKRYTKRYMLFGDAPHIYGLHPRYTRHVLRSRVAVG